MHVAQVKEDVYEKMDKELLGYVEDVLLNRCDNATERLLAYAATIEPKSKPCAVRKKGIAAAAESGSGASTWRDLPVGKRIEHALVKGLDTFIVQVCTAAIESLKQLPSSHVLILLSASAPSKALTPEPQAPTCCIQRCTHQKVCMEHQAPPETSAWLCPSQLVFRCSFQSVPGRLHPSAVTVEPPEFPRPCWRCLPHVHACALCGTGHRGGACAARDV